MHVGCRCPEHGLLNSGSPPHDKSGICAVWDALCLGLPPPLALTSLGPGVQGEYLLDSPFGAFMTYFCILTVTDKLLARSCWGMAARLIYH